MSTGEIIFIVIGAVILGFAVWRILPKVMFVFSPGWVTGRFDAGRDLTPDQREYAEEVIEPLEALGYRTAGTLVEKPPLWRRPVETLVLTADKPDGFCCVSISKRRITYYFQTLFTGGEAVITADGGFKLVNEGGLCQSVVQTDEAADVLQQHRENVADFVSEGYTPVMAYPPEVIAGSTALYYGFPLVQRGMRRYGLNNLIIFAVLCLPLVFALT